VLALTLSLPAIGATAPAALAHPGEPFVIYDRGLTKLERKMVKVRLKMARIEAKRRMQLAQLQARERLLRVRLTRRPVVVEEQVVVRSPRRVPAPRYPAGTVIYEEIEEYPTANPAPAPPAHSPLPSHCVDEEEVEIPEEVVEIPEEVVEIPAAPRQPAPPVAEPPDETQPPIVEEPPAARTAGHLSEAQREALEREIVDLINAERQSRGLDRLTADFRIRGAARGHSEEMARLNYFDHISPTPGRKEFTDRLLRAGIGDYGTAGENIVLRSVGPDTARHLVRMWMESPGHRENILRPEYAYTGVGVYGTRDLVYATQVFSSTVGLGEELFDPARESLSL
jgi:uncharacterized protein YkwD